VTKTIGDNYRIYSLIITYAGIVASVRCGLFKMSNVSHLTMLLPTKFNFFGLASFGFSFTTPLGFSLIGVVVNFFFIIRMVFTTIVKA